MTSHPHQGDVEGRVRERCPDCDCFLPFDEEWETVDEGGRPDLCWGDPLVCSQRAESRFQAYATALREIAGQDPVTLALDPQWAQRIAKEALATDLTSKESRS